MTRIFLLSFMTVLTLIYLLTVNAQTPPAPTWRLDVAALHQSDCCWALQSEPVDQGLAVYRNGLRLKRGLDYNVVNQTIVFWPIHPSNDDVMTFDVLAVPK